MGNLICPLDLDKDFECPCCSKPEYPGGPIVVYVDDTTPWDCDKCSLDYQQAQSSKLSE